MGEDKVCVGFVAGLDYTDATFSVHDVLQQFKTHPFVEKILEGGERVAWGAKTIPSGGYWAMPRSSRCPGMMFAGDGAGLCNVPELKGIHYAMHAGMYAAETIVDSLKKDSSRQLRGLRRTGARGDRRPGPLQVAEHPPGVLAGLLPRRRDRMRRDDHPGPAPAGPLEAARGLDAEHDVEIGKAPKYYPKPDGKYTFDKLSSVFASGNATRDDAPNHIRVQTHVPREVAQTWVSMCPAQVYEIPEDQLENGAEEVDLHVVALELRPVRRDHRQGRPPDSARGRRRPPLPGGLTPSPRHGACCPYGRGIRMPLPNTGRWRAAPSSAASSGPPCARV